MELQELFSNLKQSRAVIADYADLNESIWRKQLYVQYYNRKRLFNIIAAAVTGLIIFILISGSHPTRNIIPAITVAPIFFLLVRFGIGDLLDYFKRKKLKRQIKPELIQKSEEMNALVEKLDQFTVLPEKYRTLQAVDAIGNYFANKRVDTLKEAINLYEDEVYKFQQLKNQEYQIHQNGQMMQQNLKMMEQNKKMIRAQRVTNTLLIFGR